MGSRTNRTTHVSFVVAHFFLFLFLFVGLELEDVVPRSSALKLSRTAKKRPTMLGELCYSVSRCSSSANRICSGARAAGNLWRRRGRTVWSFSKSAAIVCDTRTTASGVRSNAYTSDDVSAHVRSGLSGRILGWLSNGLRPSSVLSPAGCRSGLLSSCGDAACTGQADDNGSQWIRRWSI